MSEHRTATQAAKTAAPKAAAESVDRDTVSTPSDAKGEFVRQAAYYYYEARGRVGGHELDDWLRAEAEFERTLAEGTQDAPSGTATH